MTASVLALTINLTAYTAEIVRAGLQSIPRSQIEAGTALGLTGPQIFRHVVLLPALKSVYPSLSSQFVLLMLATSVVSQISAADLFHAGSIIQSRTFRDFEVYTVVSVAYLCLTLLLRGGFSLCYLLIFRRR
jgi:polar amino acid transport system permease protein